MAYIPATSFKELVSFVFLIYNSPNLMPRTNFRILRHITMIFMYELVFLIFFRIVPFAYK